MVTTEVETRQRSQVAWAVGGVAVVVVLGALTRYLEQQVPVFTKGTWLGGIAKSVEYPVYAILLGLLGNAVLSGLGFRDRLAAGFRTEFFIKTGLVLLGGRLGIDAKLRALLASAVSICGVSAAIAAAGAVQARREQLAYTASMVIIFALPSIFLLPLAVDALGLPAPVAGAWIGGNIDTTAAVSAAGAIVGEEALQTATIVKTTQNAFLGVVAVALTPTSR